MPRITDTTKNRSKKDANKLKKATKKTSQSSLKEFAVRGEMNNDLQNVKSTEMKSAPKFTKKNMLILGALTIILLTAISYRYLLVPATVNGKPLFIWSYLVQLHKNYGKQVMNQLVDIELLNQQAEKSGVVIDPSEVEKEYSDLSAQVADSGGIEAFLASQGMS